ncbi:MAG TPA: non-ribosomal peptide synthetase [Bryobacteraceae bacterium]|nr:non-ribosomal peptide synthetase [Bryobacteraceae bacterium]
MAASFQPNIIGSDFHSYRGGRPARGRFPYVTDLVREAAGSTPEAIALSSGAGAMTFQELADRSARLATYLTALGAGPEVVVGLCLERSFDFVVSALAVLISGAAYLPLDPSWPAARLRTILEAAQAPLAISRGTAVQLLSGSSTLTIDLDTAASTIERCDPAAEPAAPTGDQLAYVIYTSGSTGEPKGVEVTHDNLLNLILWHQEAFGTTSSDRASHLAGVGFDAAVWEIWPNLAAGATLVLVDEETRTSADLLCDWLVKERITVAFVPTIFAQPMLAHGWPDETALRYLLTGGEALHRHPAAGLPFTMVNNYGPTECTVVATSGIVPAAKAVDLQPAVPPSIGRPIARTQIWILDADGHPVAPGQVGEIYIGGSSVARGYRNNPAATLERFLPDLLNPIPGSRMYRTGDLGYFLPDGQIAFRGRADSQEQIHGYRVEPDEIVCALNSHPSVAGSAVVARGEANARILVAYVVPRAGATLAASNLREFLSATLPHYMVPSTFVKIPALPFNSNGKLDRKALPDPCGENRIEDAGYRAPSTATEERLVEILSTLLGVDRVGADDNFFLLGFHSLLATQVATRVYERFGIQLSLRNLFEAKTVARLAAEVDRQLIEKLNSMSDEEVARYLAS